MSDMATDPREKIHTLDEELAKKNVKYKNIWTCDVCGQKIRMPRDAWDTWTHDQQKMFTDELKRAHLNH